jgi:thioredoxin-related protein
MYNIENFNFGDTLKKIILLLLLSQIVLFGANNIKYGKLILLYIEMENCQWCKKMDTVVFDDKQNLAKLEKIYHVVRMKKESGNIPLFVHPELFPTTYILSSDGTTVIEELQGFMKAKNYVNYLKVIDEIERGIE